MSMKRGINHGSQASTFDEQERQKILRLNREIREQSTSTSSGANGQLPRLEWLYSGDKVQPEEYLLGKKYDGEKAVIEQPQQPTTDQYSTSTIDLANKIREDPLFMIKKRN